MSFANRMKKYAAVMLAAVLALASAACADKPKEPDKPANAQSQEEAVVPVPQVSVEPGKTEGAGSDQTEEATTEEPTTEEATKEEPTTEEPTTEEATKEEPTTEEPTTEEPTEEVLQPRTGGQYVYDPVFTFMIPEGSAQMLTQETQDPSYPYAPCLTMPASAEYLAYQEEFVVKNLDRAMGLMLMTDLKTNGFRYVSWTHDSWPLSAGPGTGAKEAAEKIISTFTSRGVPVSEDLSGNSVRLTVETGADGTPLYAAWQHNYIEGMADRTYVMVFLDGPDGKLININFEYMDEGMRKAWEVFKSTFEMRSLKQ
ncbi:MAG: hypothetical protein IJM50_07080 [Lachnospiraceae bacterium]|nr:hypothetical protein [Lachnospiraceae bacterium]